MADLEPVVIEAEKPPVVATDPATQATTPTAGEGEAVETEKPEVPERTFTQKELDEIVQKRVAKESRRLDRIARAEAETAMLRKQLEEVTAKQSPQPKGEPDPKDYRDFESFQAAQIEWAVEQKLAKRMQESEAEREQRQAAEHSRAMRDRVMKGSEKFADFEEVAFAENVPISRAMAAAIAESDVPADVAYYLGSHPDEAAKISELPPTRQVREIAKIESKLTAAPKPTQAPAPIVPAGGKATAEKDPGQMSQKEHDAWMRRRMAQKQA